MGFFEFARKIAARFDWAHTKAHKLLHLPAPRFRAVPQNFEHLRNLRADAEEKTTSCWILHAR